MQYYPSGVHLNTLLGFQVTTVTWNESLINFLSTV